MWFKNLQLFRLLETIPVNAIDLDARLQEQRLRPCGNTELMTFGWVSPFGENSKVLVHAAQNCLLLAVGKEERMLPGSVVRDQLKQEIAAIEAKEGRKVYKKEQANLKDELIFKLLPRAFVRKTVTYVYLDLNLDLLIVDTSSRKKAEEITVLLRESLGTLKITPVETLAEPCLAMTQWLLEDACPAGFNLEDSCEMLDAKTGEGLIKCKQLDLTDPEIQAHLRSGKQVMSLALTWQDKISCVLNADLSIKRLRYLDLIKEKAKETNAETKAEQIDADFTLMSGELAQLFTDLFAALEGLRDLQKLAA